MKRAVSLIDSLLQQLPLGRGTMLPCCRGLISFPGELLSARFARKSWSGKTRHLQLGVYIDEALWKEFVQVYGEDQAEEAVGLSELVAGSILDSVSSQIHEYVDFVVDTAEILWDLDSMSPKLKIHMAQPVTIWKRQPIGMPKEHAGDISAVRLSSSSTSSCPSFFHLISSSSSFRSD